MLGLLERYGPAFATGWTPVEVNGEIGILTPPLGETGPSVTTVSVRDGRISAFYSVLNPEKLARLPA
jgi:RNA polymerase sigma-70 factor, ECF subfamily